MTGHIITGHTLIKRSVTAVGKHWKLWLLQTDGIDRFRWAVFQTISPLQDIEVVIQLCRTPGPIDVQRRAYLVR